MKSRIWLAALAAIATSQSAVYGLTPPKDSDGPIRLLNCVVDPHGILEAEVDNTSEDYMDCNILCNYSLGDQTFHHSFNVTIPKRFQGRVGHFDTGNGKAGNYSGEVGTCKKSPR